MLMFFEVGALKKFRNIHGKTPVLKPLFDKVAGVKTCNFIKKRLHCRFFHVNIAKFLRTASFYRTSPVAASVCQTVLSFCEISLLNSPSIGTDQ